MPAPFIPGPGAVGIVESVADDVPWLKAGTRVFLDIDLKSRTPGAPHDHILIGLTAMSPEGHALQKLWRDGTYAERVCYPAECLTPVGEAGDRYPPATLAALNFLAIAYGGLLGGGLRPGQVVAVNGATGVMGSCAVLVAIAMGAARVVSVGREPDMLAQLARLSPRVRTVAVSGGGDDAAVFGKRPAATDPISCWTRWAMFQRPARCCPGYARCAKAGRRCCAAACRRPWTSHTSRSWRAN